MSKCGHTDVGSSTVCLQLRNPRRGVLTPRAAIFQLTVRAALAVHALAFQLAVRARDAVRAVAFQLAMRAAVAVRAEALHLAMRAGVAVRAVAFQLAMRAAVAVRAEALHLAMRAGVAVRAAAFHLAMRAGVAVRAEALHLAMRAGDAVRAAVFHLAMRTPLHTHHEPLTPSSRKSPALLSRHLEPVPRGVTASASERKSSAFQSHAVATTFIGIREELVGPRLEGAVAMAQREGEADDGDAPDADGLVPVPKHEPRSPQVRASSTRHRALAACLAPVVPVSLGSRGSDAKRRAHPLTSTHHPRNARNRLARRPRWCLVSSPRAHPRAPRPPRDGLRPPRRPRRFSPRTAPEASAS